MHGACQWTERDDVRWTPRASAARVRGGGHEM